MADELDAETKLAVYALALGRYKDLISEKESRNISEIRARVSPYNDFIRRLRDSFIADMVPYEPGRHFLDAAERAMDYVRRIRTIEFAFTFWMDFSEMEKLKVATAMDKAILLAALLRSLESEDARVLVTKKGKAMVRFTFKTASYMFLAESGSLLMGDDASRLVSDDPISYSFNDTVFESYDES
ncbi:MAG: hypothetical protein V1827_01620 [Candidatus Micrarchaeota archaeon]